MNNKIMIGVAVVILLLLGGYGVMSMGKSKKTSTMPVETKTEETSKQGTLATTLKDLLNQGKDQQCNWTDTVDGRTMSGKLLISGNKFRQETMVNDGEGKQLMEVFTISDGTNFYMWNSASTQGIKTSMEESQNAMPTGGKPAEEKIDLSKQYQYNCQSATVKESDLTPPKEITFQDMKETLKQLENLKESFGKMKFPSVSPEQ